MGCRTKCLKYLIVISNLLLALIGVVVLVGGIMLLASNRIQVIILGNFQTGFTASSSGNSTTVGPSETPNLDLFIRPFAIVLIVTGSVIVAIALIGVCGIGCSSYKLLIIYSIVLIILIIAEIIVSILFFVEMFDEAIKNGVKLSLTEHYVDIDDNGFYSKFWNSLMINHSCCGVDDHKDFDAAKKWLRNRTEIFDGVFINDTIRVPFACCKDITLAQQSDLACVLNPTGYNSNWEKGCWQEIKTLFLSYRIMAIGIISAIVVAQAVLVLMAISIAWSLHRTSKYF